MVSWVKPSIIAIGRYHNKFLETIGLFAGIHEDFTPHWYRDVGSSILVTIILSLVTNYCGPFFRQCVSRPIMLSCAKKNPVESEVMDAFAPYDFMIDISLGITLNTLFVCMMYGGGLPLLNICSFISLGIHYCIDSYLLFRSRKSPKFKSDLVKFYLNMLPLSVLIHLGFTCWMVGYQDLYYHSKEVEMLFDKEIFSKINILEIWERVFYRL